jgi:flagellin
MSGIVLSASVRQNLLALQSTADLLASTQNALATGKKVNSALDNPTNFFTAQSLDNRASDIGNLLDSIGNGVQVLQAANTGITSLQKLVDSAKSIANQVLQSSVGYSSKANVNVTGTGTTGTGTAAASNLNAGKLAGSVLTFKTSTGTLAVTIGATFAAPSGGAATVNTLDQLNSVLASSGIALTASLASTADTLTFTSTNDAASQTISATGTAPTGPGVDISATTATVGTVNAAVADPTSQTTRANLVSQYNTVIQQITTTAQDSSFNGVNLLNGDNLKLTFNETGKSSLNISGVTFNASGLGLSTLAAGTDFLDSTSANSILSKLSNAANTLRSEASSLGSNLSVVQIRQDFNKTLIDVLQTGSSNLTLADTNEEAANSQALSTRQSIAVSALSLANQSQQSVLQLLR